MRNCNCFSQWSAIRRSFAVNLYFQVSERFVSHFMVFTFLNEREVLNKILLGMVCIFHQWSKFLRIKFLRELYFRGTSFLRIMKRTQKFSAARYVVVNLSKGWGENTETVTTSRRSGGKRIPRKNNGCSSYL